MRVKVFVASPGDVPERRDPIDTVVAQLNGTIGRELNVFIEAVRWETDAPRGPSDRLQAAINPLLDEADIALILFWRRCGTVTGLSASGTAEEYARAIKAWRQRGRPRVLLYFSEAPAPPPRTISEAEQLLEVARLRELAEVDGLIGTYASPEEFAALIHRDLYRLVHEVASLRRLPIEPELATALDREREACRQADRPFFTPSLLVALLKRPEGLLPRALDFLRPGLAAETLAWLQEAERRLSAAPEHRYVEFEWMERPDLQAAEQFRREEDADTISERHLLAAIMQSDGSTASALRARLGGDHAARLVDMVRKNSVPVGYGAVFVNLEIEK